MSTGNTADALRAALTRLDEIEAIFEECSYTEGQITKPLRRLSRHIQAQLEQIELGMRNEWQSGPLFTSNAE